MNSLQERHAPILDAALDAVEQALGKPARLRVRRVNEAGRYAFVYALLLRGSGDGMVDYAGTHFAEAAAHGGMSFTYAALLQRGTSRWSVLDQAIGPTDVAWLRWADDHGVPASLFDVPTD